MSNVIKFPPVHFDIRHAWQYDLPTLKKNAEVGQAMVQLFARWIAIAEFKREENEESDPELAQQEFEEDLRSGQENIFDWNWVIHRFEADQLVDAQLALCRAVLPEHNWEIVESNEHSVVANKERSLVSDLLLCDRFPASASLLYAGDESFATDPAIERALVEFIGEKIALEEEDLEEMTEFIHPEEEPLEFPPLRLVEDE